MDLILANKEELVGNEQVRGSLHCSDHEMVGLRIPRGGNEAKSGITALDFKRADIILCRDLLGGILWGVVHERREIQGS